MDVKYRKLSEIKPYEKNAKGHPDKQVKQLADSIREFGFNQPLVVDEAGVIIVGHGRYLAALSLGLDTAPVLTVNITPDQAKAYRLADNKLNESDWDMALVKMELKELAPEMIDLTGFSRDILLDTQPEPPDDPKDKMTVAVPKCTVCGEEVMCESCDDVNLV